jgi:hypothetical protein
MNLSCSYFLVVRPASILAFLAELFVKILLHGLLDFMLIEILQENEITNGGFPISIIF